MRYLIVGLVVLAGVVLSGCATITTGTDQSVTVTTEMDIEGARCKLVDKKARIAYIPNTPGTASVHKGDGPMTITCEKEFYKTVTVEVEESFQGATLGNVILGGGVGVVIDIASGAAQQYPEQVIVWMEPEEWTSEQERLEWLEAKKSYEEKIQSEKKALQASQEIELNP